MNEYLKAKLVGKDNQLTEACNRVYESLSKKDNNINELDEDDVQMVENKDAFIKLCSEEPRRVWSLLEKYGYDLFFQLSKFKNIEELRKLKISRNEQSQIFRLISIDI